MQGENKGKDEDIYVLSGLNFVVVAAEKEFLRGFPLLFIPVIEFSC